MDIVTSALRVIPESCLESQFRSMIHQHQNEPEPEDVLVERFIELYYIPIRVLLHCHYQLENRINVNIRDQEVLENCVVDNMDDSTERQLHEIFCDHNRAPRFMARAFNQTLADIYHQHASVKLPYAIDESRSLWDNAYNILGTHFNMKFKSAV